MMHCDNCQKDHVYLKLRDESLGIGQLALGNFTFGFHLRQLLLQTVNAGLLLCIHLSELWLFSRWTLQLTLQFFHLTHLCCHGGFCTSMMSCQLKIHSQICLQQRASMQLPLYMQTKWTILTKSFILLIKGYMKNLPYQIMIISKYSYVKWQCVILQLIGSSPRPLNESEDISLTLWCMASRLQTYRHL